MGRSNANNRDHFFNETADTTERRRVLCLQDISHFQTYAKSQAQAIKNLLPISRLEIQIEDNSPYDPQTALLLLKDILNAITNVQHMIVLSLGQSVYDEDTWKSINHEQWFLNRMSIMKCRAAEAALRSC